MSGSRTARLGRFFGRGFRDERGQGFVEYALILGLVSLVAVGALGFMSGKIQDLFGRTAHAISCVKVQASDTCDPPPTGSQGTFDVPGPANQPPVCDVILALFGGNTQIDYRYFPAGVVYPPGTSSNPQGFEGIYVPTSDELQLSLMLAAGCSVPSSFNMNGYVLGCDWSPGAWATPSGVTFGYACLKFPTITVSLTPPGQVDLGTQLTATADGYPLATSFTFRWYRNSSTNCATGPYSQWRTDNSGDNTDTNTPGGATDGDRCYQVTAVGSGLGGTTPESAPSNQVFVKNPPPPSPPAIDSGPANGDTDRTPTFTFHDTSSQSGISFQCAMDGGSFGNCSSAFTYSGSSLNAGSHTFSVRARNAIGLVSTPATHTWTLQQPPTPSTPAFDSTPPDPDTDTTPTFAFHDTSGQSGITFQCAIDSTSNFNNCSSPFTTGTLTAGTSHTFRVRARNTEWNLTSGSALYTWAISGQGSIRVTIRRPSGFPTGCLGTQWSYTISRNTPAFSASGSATTDILGRITVSGIPTGSGSSAYNVQVSRNGVNGSASNVSVSNNNTTDVTITVSSCP